LEERRRVQLRHERFNAALVASAVINANSLGESRVSPFDFVPGFESGPEEEERRHLKRSIATLFSRLPDDVTPEKVQALKVRTIERLKADGVEDADQLFSEVFPDL
jgi:hypothetical protein